MTVKIFDRAVAFSCFLADCATRLEVCLYGNRVLSMSPHLKNVFEVYVS